jgi:hypothetical protein
LCYWAERVKDVDDFLEEECEAFNGNERLRQELKRHGWIRKSAADLSEEMHWAMHGRTIQRYLTKLVKLKLVDRRRHQNPKYKFDRSCEYRVNFCELQKQLKRIGYKLSDYQVTECFDENDQSIGQNDQWMRENDQSVGLSDQTITENRIENIRENISDSDCESSAPRSHSPENSFLFHPDQPTVDSNASEASASKIDPPKTEKIGFAKSENSPPKKTRRQAKPVDDAFLAQITELNPHFKPEVEMPKIKTWLLKHPNRKLTRGLVVNWSNNILQRKQETVEKDETPRLPNGEIDWAKVKPRD